MRVMRGVLTVAGFVVTLIVLSLSGVMGRKIADQVLPPPAVSQASQEYNEATLGGVHIRLIPPKGYCALDQWRAADAIVLKPANERLARGPTKLLLAMAECTELDDLRHARRQGLDHYAQYQVVRKVEAEALPPGFMKRLCAAMRAAGETDLTKRPEIGDLNDFSEVKMSVLAEDATACYTASYITLAGAREQVGVQAMTVVRDRMITLTLYAPRPASGETLKHVLNAMLAQTGTTVNDLHTANR